MKLALKPVAPDAEARKTLAGAIAAHREIQDLADKGRASFERMQRVSADAGLAVDLARGAVEKAVAEEAERVAASVECDAPAELAPGMVRAAREKLADIEDQFAAAKVARERVRDQLAGLEQEAASAKERLRKAQMEVVSYHLDARVAEVERLHSELVEKRAVLWEIKAGLHPWTEAHKRLDNLLMKESLARVDSSWDRCAAVVEWRRAMDALSKDANAPIPAPARGR